ncbi:polysaccharide biosynthesis/export family protein [Pedobacter sp. MC2016-14]|uniref:polysaccharide biosynthesis/export family protein n=1 Tax=Pedobacter sp. MC2016-14 TaxID=2897327 RepID=UPI001E55FCEE|nr:polysaccharide biosynthesis/export family protein [Pedobacter sp. MC2016-14]MCD0486940.1 polysaccharide biosynthesis/export family protein [Pedobacter sp. MC2016-14]
MIYNLRIPIKILLLFTLFLNACVSNKKISYFQDIQSVQSARLDTVSNFQKPLIQPDDILSVSIFTLNANTAAVVNQAANLPTLGGGQNTALNAQSTSGFLVDENGEIELTAIGKIKVAGLTTTQARELIREKASKEYKSPNVQVRFANFIVTVLGEVNNPAAYTLPKEKVSILDAIGLAGDLTIYGKRDNILIVRDIDGQKQYARLDLNSSKIFNSPFFYLKQNDVIYVEPNKAKTSANNAASVQTIGVITSIVTVLILILTNI